MCQLLIHARYSVIARILSVSKKGKVHVGSHGLELVNVSGPTFEKAFEAFKANLRKCDGYWKHFVEPKKKLEDPLEESVSKVLLLDPPSTTPEKKSKAGFNLCSHCGLELFANFYIRNINADIKLHGNCLDKYNKANGTVPRHFTYIVPNNQRGKKESV